MKKRDKMKGKKGYAILALVIAISFITVLTWNNLVQASYKTKKMREVHHSQTMINIPMLK